MMPKQNELLKIAFEAAFSMYGQSYTGTKNDPLDPLNRGVHGIMHAVGCARLILPVYQLYAEQVEGFEIDFNAIASEFNITSMQLLELLQIAALFHDSGRQNEGKDLWDADSAKNLKHFLISKQVNSSLAAFLELAIKHKDSREELGNEAGPSRYKLDYLRQLIQMVDCLEILRIRSHFDSSRLAIRQDESTLTLKNKKSLDTALFKLIDRAALRLQREGRMIMDVTVDHTHTYIESVDKIKHKEAFDEFKHALDSHPYTALELSEIFDTLIGEHALTEPSQQLKDRQQRTLIETHPDFRPRLFNLATKLNSVEEATTLAVFLNGFATVGFASFAIFLGNLESAIDSQPQQTTLDIVKMLLDREVPKGSLFKTVALDDWDPFAEELVEPKLKKPELRDSQIPRKAFTVKLVQGAYRAVTTDKTNKQSIAGEEYNPADKKEYSRNQSCSFLNAAIGYKPKYFVKCSEDRISIGVVFALEDCQIKRMSLKNIASYKRPYDFDTKQEAESFIDEKLKNQSWHINLASLQWHGLLSRKTDHNEVMAKFRWTRNTSIGVFSNNLESRLYAQLRAVDLARRFEEKGRAASIPITIYPDFSPYSEEAQINDQTAGESSYKPLVLALNFIRTGQLYLERDGVQNILSAATVLEPVNKTQSENLVKGLTKIFSEELALLIQDSQQITLWIKDKQALVETLNKPQNLLLLDELLFIRKISQCIYGNTPLPQAFNTLQYLLKTLEMSNGLKDEKILTLFLPFLELNIVQQSFSIEWLSASQKLILFNMLPINILQTTLFINAVSFLSKEGVFREHMALTLTLLNHSFDHFREFFAMIPEHEKKIEFFHLTPLTWFDEVLRTEKDFLDFDEFIKNERFFNTFIFKVMALYEKSPKNFTRLYSQLNMEQKKYLFSNRDQDFTIKLFESDEVFELLLPDLATDVFFEKFIPLIVNSTQRLEQFFEKLTEAKKITVTCQFFSHHDLARIPEDLLQKALSELSKSDLLANLLSSDEAQGVIRKQIFDALSRCPQNTHLNFEKICTLLNASNLSTSEQEMLLELSLPHIHGVEQIAKILSITALKNASKHQFLNYAQIQALLANSENSALLILALLTMNLDLTNFPVICALLTDHQQLFQLFMIFDQQHFYNTGGVLNHFRDAILTITDAQTWLEFDELIIKFKEERVLFLELSKPLLPTLSFSSSQLLALMRIAQALPKENRHNSIVSLVELKIKEQLKTLNDFITSTSEMYQFLHGNFDTSLKKEMIIKLSQSEKGKQLMRRMIPPERSLPRFGPVCAEIIFQTIDIAYTFTTLTYFHQNLTVFTGCLSVDSQSKVFAVIQDKFPDDFLVIYEKLCGFIDEKDGNFFEEYYPDASSLKVFMNALIKIVALFKFFNIHPYFTVHPQEKISLLRILGESSVKLISILYNKIEEGRIDDETSCAINFAHIHLEEESVTTLRCLINDFFQPSPQSSLNHFGFFTPSSGNQYASKEKDICDQFFQRITHSASAVLS